MSLECCANSLLVPKSKIKYLYFFSLFVLLNQSCTSSNNKNKSDDKYSISAKEINIDIPSEIGTHLSDWKFIGRKDSISLLISPLDQDIYLIDCKTGQTKSVIKLDVEGPDALPERPRNIDFYENNIYTRSYYFSYILNLSGRVLNKRRLTGVKNEIDSLLADSEFRLFNSTSNFNFKYSNSFDVHNQKILLIAKSPSVSFYDKPYMAIVDLKTDGISFKRIPFPKELQEFDKLLRLPMINGYCFPTLAVSRGMLVINYPAVNVAYAIETADLYANQEIFWDTLNFDAKKQPQKIFVSEGGIKKGGYSNFINSNPNFGPVKWDGYRDLYYRVYYKANSFEQIAQGLKRQAFLTVLDKNKQFIMDIPLPKDVKPRNYCVRDDGLAFRKEIVNENQLPFYIIDIQKE